jgi:two-component system nitrogen regulation sensor histidine kinase NtrY
MSYLLFLFIACVFSLYILISSSVQLKKINSLLNHILNIISLTIILPLTISVIGSVIFFKLSFSSIFNNNIVKVLNESREVAETYYDEYKTKILNDSIDLANLIEQTEKNVLSNAQLLHSILDTYASMKELSDTIIFIPSKNLILAKNSLSFSLNFDFITNETIEAAGFGKPVLMENLSSNKIRAIIELKGFAYPTYLLIGRYIDEKVTRYIFETKNAVSAYNKLSTKIQNLEGLFLSIFILILSLLTFSSKFIAKFLAARFVEPIQQFMRSIETFDKNQAQQSQHKIIKTNIIELNFLIKSFEEMINQIRESQKQIINHGKLIGTVIDEIPNGIILFNGKKQVILENEWIKKTIDDILRNQTGAKEIFYEKTLQIIEKHSHDKKRNFESDFSFNIYKKNLILRTTTLYLADDEKNFLATFVDITEHLEYEKNLFLIDIAKRITHEIKNPLTPIALSAERLEEKFEHLFTDQKDLKDFYKYTNNIKQHSASITNIIDEFLQFSRLSKITKKPTDVKCLIKDAINASKFNKDIKYIFDEEIDEAQFGKDCNILVSCDSKQLTQVFLNIFKNSTEAMEATSDKKIFIKLIHNTNETTIIIRDSGVGFPAHIINNQIEQYFTTKQNGSGLGLSIVKKIIDDHGWKIEISNDQDGHGVIKIKIL